ncbi:A24 family peptidase [Nocardioides sp. R-C-SC26]|uniref:prepilin peptidase n=1 Tax=Nocardioides sp. R-C-SC26 TaxID=2870414 RepID=UPI001E4D023C|nr:A24 family peptidase [Nocardioides sp. R-C-SC26]
MTETLGAVFLAAFACGTLGLLVPRLVAAIPEPAPDAAPEPTPGRDGAPIDVVPGEQATTTPEPTEPKELYRDIAATPGLAALAAAVGALVAGTLAWSLGASWSLLVVLPLVVPGVALAVIDWRTCLLPKRLVLPLYPLALAACVAAALLDDVPSNIVGALIGWLAVGGFYFVLWFIYPPGMGYGDVRLAGVLGIVLGYLGYQAAMYGLLAGLFLGAIGGLLLTVLGVIDRRNNPFGPWMLLGAWVGIVVSGLVAG